jgi:hypothetical protein
MITFEGYPDFRPDYNPKQMFAMGIFGRNYFKVKTENISFEFFISHLDKPDFKLNHYGVDCGTSLQWWQEKKLIHKDDPNGWVEWYIKFYYGRRHEDDVRQIARFNNFKARHGGMLKKYPDSAKTKQNLLQWAIDYKQIN